MLSYRTVIIDVAPGSEELVAGVAGKSIAVHAYQVCGDTAATIASFDAGATSISGNLFMVANGGHAMPFSRTPIFRTGPGIALNLTATTGTVTGFAVISQGP